ncbi:hypothetical protein [Ensifer sp. LC163]|uniref:hypothetical protein n=1 Tax=Ensifer sp. LC163 TaxID=1120652 RepID=UPI000812C113|nr:hypothetical protein [Ensifer sp. LC163]OCP35049.1 hypothetical protein BC360_28625 [Ensifer sp. LC163]
MKKLVLKIASLTKGRSKIRALVERDYPGVYNVVSNEFDVGFYLRRNADVRNSKIDPIAHYIAYGWKEGRDPSPSFSVKHYLLVNEDVEKANVEPFWHYIVAGRGEGRQVNPIQDAGIYDVISEEFNPDYYLATNPDVRDAGIDPIEHYIGLGVDEARDPNPNFSTRFYLENNPDIRAANINPFYHFIVAGRAEGRQTRGVESAKLRALERVVQLDTTVQSWFKVEVAPSLSAVDLRSSIIAGIGEVERILVAISHDDYRVHTGGVQLCIQLEQEAMAKAGGAYLHAYPQQPLPTLAPGAEKDPIICISLDGVTLGTCLTSDFIRELDFLNGKGKSLWLAVHSLLGHAPERIAVAGQDTFEERFFWGHDYFALCSGYNLLRNTVSYCSAPAASSGACSICIYGGSRKEHIRRMADFFGSGQFTFVPPSQVAADLISSRANFEFARSVVLPHCSLEKTDISTGLPDAGVVRVAYCGWPVYHKGWFTFEELARRHAGSGRYKFYYFGGSEHVPPYVTSTKVLVGRENPNAMIDALFDAEIDIVLLWAGWPETFSFAAHEAMAAECRIITTRNSGNVARLVESHGLGAVFDTDDELYAAFDGEGVSELVSVRRSSSANKSRLKFSGMTVDLIERESI